MNVKSLIQLIKLRPEMYVGYPSLESITHFINGFLFNNIMTNRADSVDLQFKHQFHGWVRAKLEENNNIKFNQERGYVFYINQIFQDTDQKLKVFWELCDEFFTEVDNAPHLQ